MGSAAPHWPVCIPGVGTSAHTFSLKEFPVLTHIIFRGRRPSSHSINGVSVMFTCRFLALCLLVPYLWYQSQRCEMALLSS